MSINRKELLNELYDSALYTVGAVLVSMASHKLLKEPLGTPENLKGIAKLAVAVSVGTMGTKYLQDKKILPVDPITQM